MSDFLSILALIAGPALLIAIAWRVVEKVLARRRARLDARYRHPVSRQAQVKDIGDVTIDLAEARRVSTPLNDDVERVILRNPALHGGFTTDERKAMRELSRDLTRSRRNR